MTRGNLAARHADCARLVDQSGKKDWQKRHGSTPGSSRVTRAGWLGSGWRQPASPQRASLGCGGVALWASTPGTPELWPALEPCRVPLLERENEPARARHARGAVRAERREAAQLTAKSVYWRTSAGWNPRTMSSRGMPAATSSSATGREVPSY